MDFLRSLQLSISHFQGEVSFQVVVGVARCLTCAVKLSVWDFSEQSLANVPYGAICNF